MHRGSSDAAKVRELMRRLGEEARGPGRIYLVGGASAVIIGWRNNTVDTITTAGTSRPCMPTG